MRGDRLSSVHDLAGYRSTIERIDANWASFLEKRDARLEQQRRHGEAAERVTENILEDLFTQVLDWRLQDLNNQLEYADLVLTSLGIKYLIIEAKRPGALAWNKRAVEKALDQAARYAAEQRVRRIAISDGLMLYAADIEDGGLRDRLFVSLNDAAAPQALWWLSQHGIYRTPEAVDERPILLPVEEARADVPVEPQPDELQHPKYKIPARCFAYVGNAAKTSTWKLPYLLEDGTPDTRRLPMAIQSILSNYRGAKVSTIPETAIPDVLVRIAGTAVQMGKMPFQGGTTAKAYEQLEEVLRQLDRLEEVKADRTQ